MTLLSHFTRELKLAGLYDTTQKDIHVITELAKLIDSQDLTEYDLLKVRLILEKLLKKEPLTPLTGDEDEWISDDETWDVNLRCPRVFREKSTGNCYNIHGKMFISIDDQGRQNVTSNVDSHVLVTFPYTPITEYINT
jgi:hypothetical protein